jgi:hypothetical protein
MRHSMWMRRRTLRPRRRNSLRCTTHSWELLLGIPAPTTSTQPKRAQSSSQGREARWHPRPQLPIASENARHAVLLGTCYVAIESLQPLLLINFLVSLRRQKRKGVGSGQWAPAATSRLQAPRGALRAGQAVPSGQRRRESPLPVRRAGSLGRPPPKAQMRTPD